MFLEAAVDGAADRIVTGDSDLLQIGSIGAATIVTLAAFVAELD